VPGRPPTVALQLLSYKSWYGPGFFTVKATVCPVVFSAQVAEPDCSVTMTPPGHGGTQNSGCTGRAAGGDGL
jgi:hypothetical protein